MDQSALTRTSRLTATACDRERGFGGRERQSSRDGAGSPARRIPRVRANKRGGKTMRSRERPPARRKPERAPSWRRRTSSRPRTGGGRRWRRRWPASLTIRALSKVGDVCGYAPRRGSAKPLSRRRSMYPYRSLVSRGARERQSARAECDARRPRRQKGRTVCPLLENAIRGRETKPPGDGSRASRVGFFSRLLVSATVITDS